MPHMRNSKTVWSMTNAIAPGDTKFMKKLDEETRAMKQRGAKKAPQSDTKKE